VRTVGGGVESAALGDLNRDGRLDVLTGQLVNSWDVWRQLLAIFAAKHAFRHTTITITTSGTAATATVKHSTTRSAAASPRRSRSARRARPG
jgi:hypothetical protein